MTTKGKKPIGESLIDRVYSEGYCCMYGYLTLCETRGETPKSMAKNLGFSHAALRYHFTRLRKKERQCENKPDCLAETIEEIKKS